MDNKDNKKLPIKSIIELAIWTPISLYKQFLKALILPMIILVSLELLEVYVFSDSTGESVIINLVYILVYCYFAIACHRIILLNEKSSGTVISKLFWRLIRFLGWLLIISFITGLIALPFIIIPHLMFVDFYSSDYSSLIFYLGISPAIFVMAKLSLILPAVAIDEQPQFSWAWNATRNNGWRMFVVVGILPIMFSWMQELISRDDSIWIEDIALSILSFIFLIIEISALSLSFKFLGASDNEAGKPVPENT